jgi:LEA14-like dessication related protein
MKNRMIKLMFVLISAFALFLVANKFICTPKGIAPEVIDISGLKIIKLNSDSLTVNINVLALNKNDSEIEVENIYLNLLIANDTIGAAVRTEEILMARFDTSSISFLANLSTLKAVELASNKSDTIDLRIKGDATADLGLISLPVDIDLTHKFSLIERLTETIQQDTKNNRLLVVKAAKLKSLSLGKSTVEVEFTLTNPYGIDINLKDYPSQIYINNNHSGEGNISTGILLQKENSVTDGSVIYKLSNAETVSSLFGSILLRKLEYRTTGTITLDVLGYGIQFPFNFKGELIKI